MLSKEPFIQYFHVFSSFVSWISDASTNSFPQTLKFHVNKGYLQIKRNVLHVIPIDSSPTVVHVWTKLVYTCIHEKFNTWYSEFSWSIILAPQLTTFFQWDQPKDWVGSGTEWECLSLRQKLVSDIVFYWNL